jgi:hypothetical protein
MALLISGFAIIGNLISLDTLFKEYISCQSYDQPPAPKEAIWRVLALYGVPQA